ncbi:imidazolonepropionase-like amidohydrolase [Natronospira proteinivora]|uniref:Imidazolonepropionase-like amidohydrolase n=1 Tax=Natronospira proteinivora TaxID=1807133 RepID=A0ABT1GDC6_9GAMM|nr:amidohydrolase family protein [Natronospira proteinivora]MCP1728373.1 imidazolonepropionase-like amidohydrolase [Natronospira proteinivora]
MLRTIATIITVAAATLAFPLKAEVIAITGGQVHTLGEAGVLEDATVLIRDGRIEAVGQDVSIPNDARRIDAEGRPVTPGIIDAHGQIGLVEVSAVSGSNDGAVSGRAFTAAFDVADAINPASALIPINRVEGITRAVVAPGHGGGGSLIAGQGAIIDLGNGYDTLTRQGAAMYASLGETGAQLSGGSRAAAMLHLREALQDAQDYQDNRADYERRERREYALGRLDLDALGPVLEGEMPLIINAHRASDIRAALRLATDFDLQLVIRGGAEAWKVAEELAAVDVPVLIDPLQNLPGNFESLGSTLENAARLHEDGVRFAFATGDSHNARNITQAAGNAVAHGLPHEAAMAAIMSVPADIWSIEDRVGRLESGLEADLVIWDGDPLDVTSYPDHVFIRGAEMPMETRHTRLRDRYLEVHDLTLPLAYPR